MVPNKTTMESADHETPKTSSSKNPQEDEKSHKLGQYHQYNVNLPSTHFSDLRLKGFRLHREDQNYTGKKKVSDFPVLSRVVINQTRFGEE
jgi:hypothetical protein